MEGMEGMEGREWRRRSHALRRHNVEITEEPHRNVVLCNAGLGTGLNEKDLVSTFGEYGNVEQYLLIPGKSYSFVVYERLESAVLAYRRTHATGRLCQNGHPLFLAFTESVPADENQQNLQKPDGLVIVQDFVTPDEQVALLNAIDWKDSTPGSDLKNRKVKHYGYEFIYGSNNIDINNPLDDKVPSACNILWNRLKEYGFDYPTPPNQLTVNQYAPGQGIPSHVDTHSAFFSPLISLSLENSTVMDFKRSLLEGHCEHYHAVLPARSILIMDGSSRYEWSHGIVPRTYDIINGKYCERLQRTSFTFRWVRPDGKCDCLFNRTCDTFQNHKMDIGKLAPLVEHNHVHKVYEEIASHFSDTRTKIWPSVSNFVNSLDPGTVLIDIGCGNGKNLNIREDIFSIGLEYSDGLANLAAWKNVNRENTNKSLNQVMRGNCLYLPLSSECADAAISIAVFHHLATKERRMFAIQEAIRILQIGGRALISVWAKNQIRDDVKTSYLKQDRKNRKMNSNIENNDTAVEVLKDENGQSLNINLPVHKNRTNFIHQDMLVPWKKMSSAVNKDQENNENTDNTFMRFYHVFEEGELESLCKLFDNIQIEKTFYEQGNWCIIFKKVNK